MSNDSDNRGSEWPDFVPPELAQSISSAPTEPAPVPPPARPPRASSERWFNQPARGGGSSIFGSGVSTPVSYGLIVACVAVWLLQNLSYRVSDLVMLIPSVAWAEPWRFLTSAFAHQPRALSHLGFNMLTLWLIGRFLEPILGRAKFLAVYLLSALGGGVLFVLLSFPQGHGPGGYGWNWNAGMVGASGAVFGLFGAYMVLGWFLKRPMTAVWVLLGMNVVMMVLFPGIAWQAHLGGFLVGAAATAVVVADLKRRRVRKPPILWPGLAGVLGLMIVAVVIKYAITL